MREVGACTYLVYNESSFNTRYSESVCLFVSIAPSPPSTPSPYLQVVTKTDVARSFLFLSFSLLSFSRGGGQRDPLALFKFSLSLPVAVSLSPHPRPFRSPQPPPSLTCCLLSKTPNSLTLILSPSPTPRFTKFVTNYFSPPSLLTQSIKSPHGRTKRCQK